MANIRITLMFTTLSKISGIWPDVFMISGKSGIWLDSEDHYLVHPYSRQRQRVLASNLHLTSFTLMYSVTHTDLYLSCLYSHPQLKPSVHSQQRVSENIRVSQPGAPVSVNPYSPTLGICGDLVSIDLQIN